MAENVKTLNKEAKWKSKLAGSCVFKNKYTFSRRKMKETPTVFQSVLESPSCKRLNGLHPYTCIILIHVLNVIHKPRFGIFFNATGKAYGGYTDFRPISQDEMGKIFAAIGWFSRLCHSGS